MFQIPFLVCFEGTPYWWMLWAGRFIFLANIFFNANLAFYEKGILITQRRKILNDLFPNKILIDAICIFINIHPNIPIKLIFYIKSAHARMIVEKYQENYNLKDRTTLIVELLMLLYKICLYSVVYACFWHWLAVWEIKLGIPN